MSEWLQAWYKCFERVKLPDKSSEEIRYFYSTIRAMDVTPAILDCHAMVTRSPSTAWSHRLQDQLQIHVADDHSQSMPSGQIVSCTALIVERGFLIPSATYNSTE